MLCSCFVRPFCYGRCLLCSQRFLNQCYSNLNRVLNSVACLYKPYSSLINLFVRINCKINHWKDTPTIVKTIRRSCHDENKHSIREGPMVCFYKCSVKPKVSEPNKYDFLHTFIQFCFIISPKDY